MSERTDVIKMHGNPLTLIGNELNVGDAAPDFTVLDDSLQPVKLSDFKGKTVVVTSVPSLDTGTCDAMGRRFNQEATAMGDSVQVLTISMDLPFAQKRWCGAAGIENMKVLSDYRDAEFGEAFGVLIKELRLLARTVFVVDKEGVVKYIQYVEETSEEPNYDEAITAVKKIVEG